MFDSRITHKLFNRFPLKKIGGKVAHTPWKKILDFGGNLVRVSVTVGWEQRHTEHVRMCYVALV